VSMKAFWEDRTSIERRSVLTQIIEKIEANVEVQQECQSVSTRLVDDNAASTLVSSASNILEESSSSRDV